MLGKCLHQCSVRVWVFRKEIKRPGQLGWNRLIHGLEAWLNNDKFVNAIGKIGKEIRMLWQSFGVRKMSVDFRKGKGDLTWAMEEEAAREAVKVSERAFHTMQFPSLRSIGGLMKILAESKRLCVCCVQDAAERGALQAKTQKCL